MATAIRPNCGTTRCDSYGSYALLTASKKAEIGSWADTLPPAEKFGLQAAKDACGGGFGTGDFRTDEEPGWSRDFSDIRNFDQLTFGIASPSPDLGEQVDVMRFIHLAARDPFIRDVLEGRLQGKTDEEIAGSLGVHRSTVSRARSRLRSKWNNLFSP